MLLRIAAILIAGALAASAQEGKPDFAPSDEVHISAAGTVANSVTSHPDYWVARGFDLRSIIATVCDFDPERVEIPVSLAGKSYDFALVPPQAESDETIHRLVRDAIEKRFHLAIARETRTMDVYVLTAPNGPSPALKSRPSPPPASNSIASLEIRGGSIHGANVTTALLATTLEGFLHKPVVDETTLQGVYDFDAAGPVEDLQRTLRERLGLELTPARRDITMLVVRPQPQT